MCPVCRGLHKTSENELLKSHANSCGFLSIFAIWKKGMDEFWVVVFPPVNTKLTIQLTMDS